MAQAKLRPMDLAPSSEATVERSDTVAGSITIVFHDYDGHVVPVVSFAPLGRINPNTIERCLPFIYQQIQRQQVADRREAAGMPNEEPVAFVERSETKRSETNER